MITVYIPRGGFRRNKSHTHFCSVLPRRHKPLSYQTISPCNPSMFLLLTFSSYNSFFFPLKDWAYSKIVWLEHISIHLIFLFLRTQEMFIWYFHCICIQVKCENIAVSCFSKAGEKMKREAWNLLCWFGCVFSPPLSLTPQSPLALF